MNEVEIRVEQEESPSWLPDFSKFCYKVLEYLKIEGWEVSVVLCSDRFIEDLNGRYRGKNEPTDVLSFPQDAGGAGQGGNMPAGDIVISIPAVARNAAAFAVDFEEETRRVFIHGVLHLMGMDHDTNNANEPMLVLQEETLHALTGEM